MNRIKKIIRQFSKEILVNGEKASAVIYPVRRGKDGNIGSSDSGRFDIKRYYMFTDGILPEGTGYGSIVSDGENEYYILWTDEWKTAAGEYTKVCMRKTEVKA